MLGIARCVMVAAGVAALIGTAIEARGEGPAPDAADVRYGPHGRDVLDFWKAKGEDGKATPLVVFIHGGGFRGGDKAGLPAGLVAGCLEAGISVASINYRLSEDAPFPAPMLDGARAIQFLREKADRWGIDPDRIAASGGSAGAGIALWIGFHDDLADPESDDPIARRSTRLAGMAVLGAQSSYDPRFIKSHVGGRAHEHPALRPFFGLKPDEPLASPRVYPLYEAASAINLVSADDPPVFLYYSEPKGALPDDSEPGKGIHHPNFGVALREALEPLGIACAVRHRDDYRGPDKPQAALIREMIAFFRERFGIEPGAAREKVSGPNGRAR